MDEDRPEDNVNNGGGSETKNSVACRLLAQSNQVGCVLGRGGKIVEKIRQETGAQIRVLPKDQLPACAYPGDELIQVMLFFFSLVLLFSCFSYPVVCSVHPERCFNSTGIRDYCDLYLGRANYLKRYTL